VQFDHLPYLPFPSFWPTYTPKDKLADWLETYAAALELNIWTSSRLSASTWNEATKSWTVTISREGHEDRKFQPRHIVLATGATGPPKIPAIVGEDSFKGQYLHSVRFVEAQSNSGGKKAVVIGSGNSGHDIAQDYYEKGWDVTIVQRGRTCVVSGDALVGTLMKGLYDEDGVSRL
jgi:cation diffusion facilitator CzcD-associated flavoprotein CzcO